MRGSVISRSDYPALADVAYLNQASLGMMSEPTVRAMQAFIGDVARHGNLVMSDEDEVSYFARLRGAGASILGTTQDRVAVLGSASEILGQLPLMLPLESRPKVVLVSSDFPAVTRSWLRLQAGNGCRITFVDDDPGRDLTESICSVVDSETAVVAVSYVQYATGRRIDPERLRDVTDAVGATLVLDATQAAGAMAIHADRWGADLVVSSGYKWLGGHGGAALAVVGDRLLDCVPALPGWMGATEPFDLDATHLDLAPDARRFTQATMSYASMAALTTSIGQLLDVGMDVIEGHAHALSSWMTDRLQGTGWTPYLPVGDPGAAPHIVSLASADHDVDHAVQRLASAGVVCGVRGGRIRVSLAAYNDAADVDRLVGELTSV